MMRSQLLFFILIFLPAIFVKAQLSVKDPFICHDKNGYLVCFNSGSYMLRFSTGNFESFITADSSVFYSNAEKKFIIYRENHYDPEEGLIDTLIIQLKPRSIHFAWRDTSAEITSLEQLSSISGVFGLNYSTIEGSVKSFGWSIGNKEWKIEVDTWAWNRDWVWSIYASDSAEGFMVDYNSWKKGRLETIGIQNDSLRYGMSISTTFRSRKKIADLVPVYIEKAVRPVWGEVITDAIVEKKYYYNYNKKGRLKKKGTRGEIKTCTCP